MPKLSLVLITLNAAGSLRTCLDSARELVDEIVILDSGSTDDTLRIAKEFGARSVHQDFLGFGPQKRRAVAEASHNWVLCLDADERLTPELAASIRHALANPVHPAYRMVRCNRFLGRHLRHGEGYPDILIRLFDRRHANWSEDQVHEHVLCAESSGMLQGDLIHDSAETLASYIAKQNRYTDMQANQLFATGRRIGGWKLFASPLIRFLRFYLMRKGFLDGTAGFAHIAIGAFFSFVKYAKLLELQISATHSSALHVAPDNVPRGADQGKR